MMNQQDPLKGHAFLRNDDIVPVAQATPFLPGISGGIWSPPNKLGLVMDPETEVSTLQERFALWLTATQKDDQIRALQKQIAHLTVERSIMQTENARLVHEVHQLSSLIRNQQPGGIIDRPRQIAGRALGPTSPTTHTPPSYDNQNYLPPFRDSLYQAGGHSIPDRHMGFHSSPNLAATLQDPSTYHPSQQTVDLILSGKLDYMRMDPRSEHDLIRPLVWTIAHQEPKNNTQAATLKIAANALGSRLGQPRSMPITHYLISVILEWAKPLCFTSNGNYLCQQLLDKGTTEDKINFIKVIENDVVPIANNKFGAHVLVKAVGVKELEGLISAALLKYGIYESMQTGARKVWRPYLCKCRSHNQTEIFDKIKETMKGRWADLAVSNENGSISVQQIFEGCANQDLIDACFHEASYISGVITDIQILEDISRVANNQFGHFAINKLLNFHETFIKPVSHAILTAYPPLATNHHGVQFVEFVISSNRIQQRNNIVKYIESLCSQKDGRTPAMVPVANSSVGRGHLQSILRQVPPGERALMSRVHNTCRQFQTTLRNSQSGNELLRSLSIINTPARRV
ncbi:Meiotic coiled-coil protein 2 [Vanrija pseudolonga]|uniref:Meiotic coiled-coil protein 2 n=1 Tax=Vanrija pseudolonga TaxID=143232 RepID=A0AAF0Y0P0_9TREE|nr:Meiotic coiled-coil protein 2 [Vanrija pseudolonga]